MRPASLFCLIVLVLVVLFPSDYELVLAYKITRINEGGFRHKKHVILIAAGSTGSSTPNLSSAASNKIASNNSYNMRNSAKRQLNNSSTPLSLSQFPSNTTTNININAHNKTKSSATTKTTISSTNLITTTSNTLHSTTPTSPSSHRPSSNSHHTTTSHKTTSGTKSTSSSKSSSSSHSAIASSVPDTPVPNPASISAGGNSPADNNDLTPASQNSSVSSTSSQITPQQTGSLGSGSSPTADAANSGSGSSDTQETQTSQPGNTNNQNFAPKGPAPDKLVGPVIGGVFGTIAGVGIVVLLAVRYRRKCASLDSQNSSANWSDYDQLDPPVEPTTRFRPSSFLIAVRNAVNKLPRDSANITGQSKFVEKMDFERESNGSQNDHFVDMR